MAEPLIRVMALHAMAYCPRLFYLEEVAEIPLCEHCVQGLETTHSTLKQPDWPDQPQPFKIV